jgi:hypothetical protein
MRHDARQRHGEVVAQRQIGLPARLVLAALEDLEDELIALVAVLAQQRLEVLDRRRLERLEAVALVDPATTPITCTRRRTSSGRKSRMPRAGSVRPMQDQTWVEASRFSSSIGSTWVEGRKSRR